MRHSLRITELLPLKVFYLGFALKNHAELSTVIDIVDESIERCRKDDYTRTVFYLLLKCELSRDTDSVIKNRETTKVFCEECGAAFHGKDDEVYMNFFNNYMKIVNSTFLPTKIVGGGAMSIVKKAEISDHEDRPAADEYGNLVTSTFDTPLEALGLHRTNLKKKDYL